MRSVGFLACHQDLSTKPKTFLSKEDADLLVAEMAAERISNKLIRAFPPHSSFRTLKPSSFIPLGRISSAEPSGLRFQLPTDPAWREQHGMATHSLQTRAFMTLKAWNSSRVSELRAC
jgi:hypothetical protein